MSLIDSAIKASFSKLAVCIPARDQMHTATSFCLYNLAEALSKAGIEHRLFVCPGTLIANQRHELVMSALDWGATHVLFIDSDIVFEPHHVLRMLRQDLDVLGAAYSKRVVPLITTAWAKIDDWDSWIRVEDYTEDRIQVQAMALGFCLIKTSVFERVPLPWFQLGFYDGQYTGEDIEFFRALLKSDIPAWLDLVATKDIGHLGTYEFRVCLDN